MSTQAMPDPTTIFDTLFAYEQSAALKSALELDLFTAVDEGAQTAVAIANRCAASERGIRILCDFLTTLGLLTKAASTYQLSPEATVFLSQRSPAYLGTMARFLLMPGVRNNFEDLTGAVRRGGVQPSGNTVTDENPIWIEFARSMTPMMVPAAHAIADLIDASSAGAMKVLDIAASHGIFGITIAQRNPRAEIVAVDWKNVLPIAEENARAAAVGDRYRTLHGDAFQVDFGHGFDVALVTNFLHHFDTPTCTSFLKKIHAALQPGGRVVILEMVPNPDRVSPPVPARFALTMLAGTLAGDAYTFDEFREQLESAGFRNVSAHAIPTPETVLLATK
jgi:2-polyprenyl-3-methyl-5-hydroxy-6-metoxy-1,4-benzoquinol methylase